MCAVHGVQYKLQHRRTRSQGKAPGTSSRIPLAWLLVTQLNATSNQSINGLQVLRKYLDQQAGSTLEKGAAQGLKQPQNVKGNQDPPQYAHILLTQIKSSALLSTDILILVELAEAVERGLTDDSDNLYATLSRCYSTYCSNYEYPLSATLRSSVFKNCAAIITSWSELLADYRLERWKQTGMLPLKRWNDLKKNGEPNVYYHNPYRVRRFTLLPTLYSFWQAEDAEYRASAAEEMPMGPDAGKLFGNPEPKSQRRKRTSLRKRRATSLGLQFIGKRGVRRFQRWLLAEDVIKATLDHLNVLLYPKQHSTLQVDEAKSAPHPWWTNRKNKQSVEAIRPSQHNGQRNGTPVPLGKLLKRQKIVLRNQLREQLRYKAEFERIQPAMRRFLADAPPTYPVIVPMQLLVQKIWPLPEETRAQVTSNTEQNLANYRAILNRFRDFRPRRGDPRELHSDEKLYDIETMNAQELEQAAALLLPGSAQPITYAQTMGVKNDPKAFALLFYERHFSWGKRNRYILACEFLGEEAPERQAIREHNKGNQKANRFFVNAPLHRFIDTNDSTFTFFAVHMGTKQQGRYLKRVLVDQEAATICAAECKVAETGSHSAKCQPKAAITTATITEGFDHLGRRTWYANLSIPVATKPVATRPNAVVGFHEYRGRYYYAVIDLEGNVIEIGKVPIKRNVHPETPRGHTSDNFAFETAWSLVRLCQAKEYTAVIGIEDTAWKAATVSIDSEENRENFAHPRERIVQIAEYKATTHGFLKPIKVKQVAPSRDCGHCKHRIVGRSGIQIRAVQCCFHCLALGKEHQLTRVEGEQGNAQFVCTTCGQHWDLKEPVFKCPQCGKQQHARLNAAIVVARRLLNRLGEGGEQGVE